MVEISREIAERFVIMSLIQLFALIEVNNIINKNQKGSFFPLPLQPNRGYKQV